MRTKRLSLRVHPIGDDLYDTDIAEMRGELDDREFAAPSPEESLGRAMYYLSCLPGVLDNVTLDIVRVLDAPEPLASYHDHEPGYYDEV